MTVKNIHAPHWKESDTSSAFVLCFTHGCTSHALLQESYELTRQFRSIIGDAIIVGLDPDLPTESRALGAEITRGNARIHDLSHGKKGRTLVFKFSPTYNTTEAALEYMMRVVKEKYPSWLHKRSHYPQVKTA